MADLSIIIVSWNVCDLLAACLDSIITTTWDKLELELIVVDSASTDATVVMLGQRYPQVRLLPQTQNLGFTRCNNLGLQAATGRHLMLLNPDTEVIGNALVTLVNFLDTYSDVGIVGPHTLNSDGTTQSTRRRFPTPSILFVESTWLQPYVSRALLDTYYLANSSNDNNILEVDWAQGSALMARRAVYEQVGGLDEGYVMYSEEVDWCKRAKNAGWRVFYVGTAQIIHHGGKSTEQVVARSHVLFQKSKLRYTRKYHGWLMTELLRGWLLLNYIGQYGLEVTKWLLGHKRNLRRDRMRAYANVIRTGLR